MPFWGRDNRQASTSQRLTAPPMWLGTQNHEISCLMSDKDRSMLNSDASDIGFGRHSVITAAQMRAARALLRVDQRELAELSGLSLPTIQRMEASDGVVRGNVDSLMKLVGALAAAGIELITDGAVSAQGGRGVRLTRPSAAPRRVRPLRSGRRG
jgi:hypothetical protein